MSPIVGGTEAEAHAKRDEYLEQVSTEAGLSHLSSIVGADLGAVDPDRPLDTFHTESVQGILKGLIDNAPPGTRTFRDLARTNMTGQFTVGSVEQMADRVEAWYDAGIDGLNLAYSTTPGTFRDFVDGVVPILQERGIVQREYAPGPLREKLFGHARLPDRHPAAAYRR